MRVVNLKGGPGDGRTIQVWGSERIIVALALPPKRHAGPDDHFTVSTDGGFGEWVDPELRWTFERHAYGKDGTYVGKVDA